MWKALLISAFAAGLVLVAAKDTVRASGIFNNNASDSVIDTAPTQDTADSSDTQGTSDTSGTSNSEEGTSDNSSTSDSEEDTSNSSIPSDTEGTSDTSSTLDNRGILDTSSTLDNQGTSGTSSALNSEEGTSDNSSTSDDEEDTSNFSNPSDTEGTSDTSSTLNAQSSSETDETDANDNAETDKTGCNGDPNAQPGCGVNCGRTCSTYQQSSVACPAICYLNACDCKNGFVFDDAVQKCVLPAECSPVCGPNEIVSNCSNAGCGPLNCTDLGKPLLCIDVANCTKGCVCQNEYLRADNGTCVPKDQCPGPCGGDPNAKPGCGVNCGKTCSTYKVKNPICPRICKVNGCDCKDGFVFDGVLQKCVLPADCSPTCGANEMFSTCINGGCDARNCSQVGKPVPCVKLDPKSCIKGCVCDSGFLRASNGTCVPTNQCGAATCTGQNEFFDECISGCSSQTCADIGKMFQCPIQTTVCRTGCRCKPGFWRNSDNVCVPESQCPTPPCPDSEIYDRCPTVKCEGDYCPKTRDSPLTCPVGIVCDPPRCVCGFNSHRDRKTGKCIATADCPPFACNGPNEEYQPCPPVCPGENCSDYINNSTCPRFRIGIVVPCKPQCKCKKGYYRNADGVCIIGYQCGPKKSSTTSIPTTTTTITTTTKAPPTPRPGNSGATSNASAIIASLKAGISELTGKFLYDRMQASKGENVIISAFSVFTPLAQLALGARGDSLKQLLTVLHANNQDDIRNNFPALTASYEGQKSVIFSLASKVYSNVIYKLSESFINDSVNVFNAESEEVNFNDSSKAADTINQWIANETNNRITDLVSPDMFSEDTRIALINAILFKGNWLYQFDAKNTQDQPFYLEDGTTKTTKLMYQEATLKYGEHDELGCKSLQMFYKGSNFSMVVVLPNNNNGVLTLAEKLQNSSLFNKVIGTLRSQKVKVWLPKFEIQTKTDLSDILRKQNVTKIFGGDADLQGILAQPQDVFISTAVQVANIIVDEEGSVAVAANGGIGTSNRPSPPPPPPKEFRADHGFLYYIRVNSVTVFCGSYLAFIGTRTASIGPVERPPEFRADHSFLYYILVKGTPVFSGSFRNPN